jgi:hypothetical protein
MANVQMPIEIKPDNTIVPLQHLSTVYVISIIDSINDIIVDRTLPDIVSQADRMFQERVTISTTQEPLNDESIVQKIIVPDPNNNLDLHVSQPQLWIRTEELRKAPSQFKKNTSFKNRGKYNHRTTVKTREYIDSNHT